VRAFGLSNQGLVRTNNEDAFLIDETRGLLIVADGMGGHAGGEEASALAIQTVIECLNKELKIRPEETIRSAILAANRVVLSKSAAEPDLAGMGTTLTLVAVLPDYLITGHIGDSKAFLLDRSVIRCLTGDHSVSGQLLATGKITDEEAFHHPQRHVLTRALGTEADLDAEIRRHPWSSGQYVLICSDGLTEVVSPGEIHQVAAGVGDLKGKVSSLINMVLDRGAPDNVTVILAEL